MPSDPPMIAVVGATGAVGREALAILAGQCHPVERVIALASHRSAARQVPYASKSLRVHAIAPPPLHSVAFPHPFPPCDFALFCATADVARDLAPRALDAGAIVIDNSATFRADPAVPLVIPEVNPHELGEARLIANPNCSTIILLTALTPIRRRFGVRKIVVSTYQAVSGAGIEAVSELQSQSRAVLDGLAPVARIFPEPCAFNVFSHESVLDPDTGLNAEETKMIAESRRLWNDPTLELIPTCVRVPVVRAHTQSVVVTLERPASEDDIRRALADAPGVRLEDNRADNRFPTPLNATGTDAVLAGRIRRFSPTEFGVLIAGDQLRKGAALNAVQIMQTIRHGGRSAGRSSRAGWAGVTRSVTEDPLLEALTAGSFELPPRGGP